MQELTYEPPTHEFKMVPSSLGPPAAGARPRDGDHPRRRDPQRGFKVAILVGQGARGAAAEVERVADLLGAGVAKALLGKDVLSDELPFVTGSIGLLGTRPSYEMMGDCDTLLTSARTSPTRSSCPTSAQARAVQIDIDAR